MVILAEINVLGVGQADAGQGGRTRGRAGQPSRAARPTVDQQAVASVVADWTGIPVGRMVKDEVERLCRKFPLYPELQ